MSPVKVGLAKEKVGKRLRSR